MPLLFIIGIGGICVFHLILPKLHEIKMTVIPISQLETEAQQDRLRLHSHR